MVKLVAVCGAVFGVWLASCSSAPAYFVCGQTTCDPQTQYCDVRMSGSTTIPTTRSCEPLPTGCRSCDCVQTFAAHPSCDTCCGCHDFGGELTVYEGSSGYDGAFVYRLALDPFTEQPVAHGITLDNPSYRQQRIVLPLVAWLADAASARCWIVC